MELSNCHSVDKILTCEQFFPCVIFTMLSQVEFADLKVLVMFVSQYFLTVNQFTIKLALYATSPTGLVIYLPVPV